MGRPHIPCLLYLQHTTNRIYSFKLCSFSYTWLSSQTTHKLVYRLALPQTIFTGMAATVAAREVPSARKRRVCLTKE